MGAKLSLDTVHRLLLAAVIAFSVVTHGLWLSASTDIVGVDVSNHLYFQLKFHRHFIFLFADGPQTLPERAHAFISLMGRSMFHPDCIYWPNLVFLVTSLFTLVFGYSLLVVKLSTQIFLVILLLSTYLIARALNKTAALLAVFIVSMYPIVFEGARQYGLDLPLTALVCLSMLFLIRTEGFTRAGYSFALGMAMGAGMLIKGQYLLFLAGPFLLEACRGVFGRGGRLPVVLRNLSLTLLAALPVAGIWWASRMAMTWQGLITHVSCGNKFLEADTLRTMYDLAYYFYNLKVLVCDSSGVWLSAVFLVSLLFFLRTRGSLKNLLLCWLFVPAVLFSFFFVVKQDRFLMPVLPVMALISGWGLSMLRPRWLRLTLLALVLSFALVQYYVLSFSRAWYAKPRSVPWLGWSSYGPTPYQKKPFFDREKMTIARETAAFLRDDASSPAFLPVGIAILSGHLCTFEVFYWLHYYDPAIQPLDWVETYDIFHGSFDQLEYVLVASLKEDGPVWPGSSRSLELARKYQTLNEGLAKTFGGWDENMRRLERSRVDFEPVRSFEFSSGLIWTIYKRRGAR